MSDSAKLLLAVGLWCALAFAQPNKPQANCSAVPDHAKLT